MLKGFNEYQPSKTQAFWLGVICIVATLVIGFTWGGWVTAGSAGEMVDEATQDARVDLAAEVCVEQFKQGAGANERLEALKKEPVYSRDEVIEDGGWAVLPGAAEPVPGVTDACAERVAELEHIADSAPALDASATAQSTGATSIQ